MINLKHLAHELDGVIAEVERDGFDYLCMSTLKRVRAALAHPDGKVRSVPVQQPNVVVTAPERIYLVIGEDCPPDEDFNTLDDISWCVDKIDENSIEYVRADLKEKR